VTADRFAEAVVAACAAATRHGCQLAHQRLTAGQFTDPAYAAVFTAARQLAPHPMPTEAQATNWARAHLADQQPATIWPSELRLAELADRLETTIDDLQQLLDIRPVADDTTGTYANRVADAHARRQLEQNTVTLHELVRQGDTTRAAALATQIGANLAGAAA
jgi:replicative DNA helicase